LAIDSTARHATAGKRRLLDLAGKTLAANSATTLVTRWRTAGGEERTGCHAALVADAGQYAACRMAGVTRLLLQPDAALMAAGQARASEAVHLPALRFSTSPGE